jgi:hypothetical protein
MSRLLAVTFWCALALWQACWWNFDDWSDDLAPVAQLGNEPTQARTRMQGFNTTRGGVPYMVQPLYDYELHGLVVSRRFHDGRFGLHRLWGDHLSAADLCVVWGSNARLPLLKDFEFESGEFTCFFRTRSSAAWAAFVPEQVSNNHLLVDEDWLRGDIEDAQVGDQVHIKGVLAEYRTIDGFYRGTSTSRTDTGNGACETIFVQSFRVLQPMQSFWRSAYDPAWLLALASGGLWLLGVARGRW